MSLQIPPLTSTPYLPSASETSYPGLWLTTADSLSATDEATGMESTGANQMLAKNFALLLLSDEATILKDVESSSGALGPPLAHYIRSSKPTKSFIQISAQSSIPLNDIQVLANHLIYWRRARAVPPLNKRDTYIVSPNCDLSKLDLATAAYEATFPTQPSLPKMLSMLSGPPRPYYTFFPSKDHKDTYYAILAWLLRGGWVTQLRTFGWIKVSPEIKISVEEAMLKEEDTKDEERQFESTTEYLEKENFETSEDDRGSSSSSSLESESSGEATPVPARSNLAQIQYKQQERNNRTTSSVVLRPHRASPVESRWLDEVLATISENSTNRQSNNDGPEDNGESPDAAISLARNWPLFIKYFNGTDALEKIPVREGLNRTTVWRWLTRLDIHSRQQQQQHPDGEIEQKERVLITVRHW